jgi:hypothetical protein
MEVRSAKCGTIKYLLPLRNHSEVSQRTSRYHTGQSDRLRIPGIWAAGFAEGTEVMVGNCNLEIISHDVPFSSGTLTHDHRWHVTSFLLSSVHTNEQLILALKHRKITSGSFIVTIDPLQPIILYC